MQQRLRWIPALVVVALVAAAPLAFGQGAGTTASLSGLVVDSSGAVLPGADVVAKHAATSAETHAVSDATGRFTIPALQPGTYRVTVSLMGFKTAVLPDVQLVTATPSSVKAVLEIGNVEETVVVTGATEIVQTQTAAVTTTLTTAQISSAPLPTRNTLDFVAMLPGVNTPGNTRDSSVMGLRPSATNITIDGINVQDNFLKSSDGFFARINPRLDAVEEVTVSTANPGAESAGQGAVQIRFATRSGTNKLQGSVYHYIRRPQWNTNYWFNKRDGLPNDKVKVDTWGFRVGGPAIRDRLFYFFNFEEFRQPGEISRTRTVLTPDAVNGTFRYNGGPAAGINLYALAAKYNQTSTPDPTMLKLLNQIQGTLDKGKLLETGNPITRTFSWINASQGIRRYPTTRIDYNVTQNHRAGVSVYFQQYDSFPDTLNTMDPAFPGFPNQGGQYSMRWSVMGNLRSTLKSNMVNEARWGATGGPVEFGKGYAASQFDIMGGFGVNFPIGSNAWRGRTPNERDAPTYVLEDTLNWLRGSHSWTMGGSFTQVNLNYVNHTLVPTIDMGVDSNDPANTLFTGANFPGASGTDLNNARALYALLTGRVTAINGRAYLDGGSGTYKYIGDRTELGHQRELGLFVQDSWRVNPNLTLNYGVRYELQLPFVALNDYYSQASSYDAVWGVSGVGGNGQPNLFMPGTMTGSPTTFVLYGKGAKAFKTDWNNFAPSAGVNWSPKLNGGSWLAKILSDSPVLRGGYSMSYLREGIGAFSNIFSYNPGGNIEATRSMALGNLVTSNSQLPVLMRDASRLGPPAFAEKPQYPVTPSFGDSVNAFYPETKTPYAHSWNIGFQRTLTKNTAMELRYVATRMKGGWVYGGRNMNEVNVLENKFIDEFKLAQANLQANIAAGRGSNFRYYGPGTGTSPLPTYLAYFSGIPASQAGDPKLYTSSNFASSTFYNQLSIYNPNLIGTSPAGAAYSLHNNASYRANAAKAGLPANFFYVNPGMGGGVYITGRPEDSLDSMYDAIQLELRRRFSSGLLLQGSYQYVIRSLASTWTTLRKPQEYVESGIAGNYARGANIHAFKLNWVFELPFGQGKKWGSGVSSGWNRLIGGWTFDGNGRIQSGNLLDFGNVRLVNMTDTELQGMFKLHKVPDADGKTRVYMLPLDVIDNSIMAFSTSATSTTGYGSLGAPSGKYIAPIGGPDCVQAYVGSCGLPLHHYVYGPKFVRFDMAIGKRIDLVKNIRSELRLEALNVFDAVNFYGRTFASPYTSRSDWEVNSAYRDSNNTQDPGGRLIQLSWRISW